MIRAYENRPACVGAVVLSLFLFSVASGALRLQLLLTRLLQDRKVLCVSSQYLDCETQTPMFSKIGEMESGGAERTKVRGVKLFSVGGGVLVRFLANFCRCFADFWQISANFSRHEPILAANSHQFEPRKRCNSLTKLPLEHFHLRRGGKRRSPLAFPKGAFSFMERKNGRTKSQSSKDGPRLP